VHRLSVRACIALKRAVLARLSVDAVMLIRSLVSLRLLVRPTDCSRDF
jgi:hypothetical protein